ncbi:MAG: Uma2 family endonuclease [Caldilineaceae bacterium SB0668_bin_21]|nr:Uma2 family endonuclease [Caldilineaceae bacterium SB0668_bin_21]MYC20691.1 Uma2 family endonuclease [Caldilineaceae bacterium SB0662_bin_25]
MTALAGQCCSDRGPTVLRAEPVSQNSPATTILTYEDYLKTPNEERYELLNRALLKSPSPNTAHQSVQAELGWRMARLIREGGLGHLFFAPTDVVLSRTDVVQPDLLFISSERAHIIAPANIQGAPDLIVEIRSDSTAERDEAFKRQLYANCGVEEYWLVDPEAATISVLMLGENGYDEAATYTVGQTLTSPMLDGLLINLDDLFLVRDSKEPTT